MLVYRIERDGDGPYENGDADPDAHYTAAQPGPGKDGCTDFQLRARDTGGRGIYGCPSFEALEKWFSRESLFDFERKGYELRVYEAASYYVGVSGKQVCFDQRSARLVSVRLLTEPIQ